MHNLMQPKFYDSVETETSKGLRLVVLKGRGFQARVPEFTFSTIDHTTKFLSEDDFIPSSEKEIF